MHALDQRILGPRGSTAMKGGTSPGGLPTAARKTFVCRLGVLPLPDPSLCWPLISTPLSKQRNKNSRIFVLRMSHPPRLLIQAVAAAPKRGWVSSHSHSPRAETLKHTHTGHIKRVCFSVTHCSPHLLCDVTGKVGHKQARARRVSVAHRRFAAGARAPSLPRDRRATYPPCPCGSVMPSPSSFSSGLAKNVCVGCGSRTRNTGEPKKKEQGSSGGTSRMGRESEINEVELLNRSFEVLTRGATR